MINSWLLAAVILAESSGNPKIVSVDSAVGLMQMTPIGVEEARRQCNLPDHTPNLVNPTVNVQYGTCLLGYYIKVGKGIKEGLILYNGGYKALRRYRQFGTLNEETDDYVNKIDLFRRLCTDFE